MEGYRPGLGGGAIMNIPALILENFIRHQGQFLSGTDVGNALGLSRVSVHNHLEALRKEGFVFSAIRNKGYRLETEPDRFHPALFDALMAVDPCVYFQSYTSLESVGSTNSFVEKELSRGSPAPLFAVADLQEQGRGRRGRVWHSPAGKNLYISAGLRPGMSPARLQTITLWMGLRLCKYLRDRFSLPVLIKWPNDLMLHDRKIAGMLTEARVDSEYTRDLVFGLGLNVNAAKEDFPEDLAGIASSLSIVLEKNLSLSRLAHEIVHLISVAFKDYLEDAYREELAADWPVFDYLRRRQVCIGDIEGKVLGISANGSLRLERSDGSTVLLHSGEVSIGSAD